LIDLGFCSAERWQLTNAPRYLVPRLDAAILSKGWRPAQGTQVILGVVFSTPDFFAVNEAPPSNPLLSRPGPGLHWGDVPDLPKVFWLNRVRRTQEHFVKTRSAPFCQARHATTCRSGWPLHSVRRTDRPGIVILSRPLGNCRSGRPRTLLGALCLHVERDLPGPLLPLQGVLANGSIHQVNWFTLQRGHRVVLTCL
jgi:hypothetical protein